MYINTALVLLEIDHHSLTSLIATSTSSQLITTNHDVNTWNE